LTWKKKGWLLISLFEVERTIENLLSEIAVTDNPDIIRSRTFIIKELVEWYEHYVDKIISSHKKGEEIAESLNMEMSELQQRFKEVLNNVIKSTKLSGLQVELRELTEIAAELEEIKHLLTSKESQEDLEEMIKPLAGDKDSEDSYRKEKLWTDIDEEMEAKEGVKGEWAVVKYVLLKKKAEEIRKRANDLNLILNSLDELTQKLVDLTNAFLKLFKDESK